MVAEEFRIGGTCVIRGCVPKKLLVYASRFADAFRDAAGFGWTRRRDALRLAKARRGQGEAEITRLSGLYRKNLEGAKVEIVETARRRSPGRTRSSSPTAARFPRATSSIATGAHPQPLPGLEGAELAISSNEVFDLAEFPRRLLVVGGGYIAVEFASLFQRLGAKVTEVMRADNVLRGFDEDMRVGLRDEMTRAGVDLRFGVLPKRIEKRADGLARDASPTAPSEVFDQVLVATGRAPNTRGLGLEAVGVELDAKGAVKVDAGSTSNVPSIHAVGDVTDRINLTPVAIREGHVLADRLFGGGRDGRSRKRRDRGVHDAGDRHGRA